MMDYLCLKIMQKVITRMVMVMAFFSLMLSACRKDEPEEEKPPFSPTPFELVRPDGFPAPIEPTDNPTTVEGVALGRKLFYETLLSANNTQSCGSCHNQALGFSDNGNKFSTGIDGIQGTRNAQGLVNLAFNLRFFWDGRAESLEEQALEPIPNPIEMHQRWPDAVAKLKNAKNYKNEFYAAFGTYEFDSLHVAKALAQFMRSMVSYNSRLDKRLRYELNLTPQEMNGFSIYITERGDCFHCHNIDGGRLLTDNQFHNNGLDSVFTDLGLGAITGNVFDNGKFLTPSLRNVALTAPYMHDGRFSTLEEVVEHYNSGGKPSATVDPLMKHVGTGLNLSAQDKAELVAFLKTFTDSTFITNPAYSNPF
jgi:cytochrome c peroxidase